MGNRTSMTRNGTAYSYVYDNHDKLTSASGGGKNAWFYYSPKGNPGNITGDLFGGWELWYDDENRLIQVTYPPSGVTDTFTYNWAGLRTRATLAGTTYRYLYNGERVLEELNDSGTMTARYTTENGSYYGQLLHLKRATGESRFPLYDAIGDVERLVDGSATVTDSYTLDSFGRQLSGTTPTPNPYRFGGAWGYITDPSGLLQLGERFYWPELGRFVSQDPARHGRDWYVYGGDNPLTGIDPEGLGSWSFVGGCSGISCLTQIPWFYFLYGAKNACALACYHYPTESDNFWNCMDACNTIFPGGGGCAHGITIRCTKTRVRGLTWEYRCESTTMP